MQSICALGIGIALAGSAAAAPNVTNATQKGSLLIFRDIRTDNTAAQGQWDTLIRIQTDGTSDVTIKCYWMDGNKNRVDFIKVTVDGMHRSPADAGLMACFNQRELSAMVEEAHRLGRKVLTAIQSDNPGVELRRTEVVGGQVGAELAEKGALAVLFTFFFIMLCVWARYQWRLGDGAIVAALHDPIIILGFFAATQMTFEPMRVQALRPPSRLTRVRHRVRGTPTIPHRT